MYLNIKSINHNITIILTSFLIICLSLTTAFGQNSIIKAFVYDQETKDILPYCSISIMGTSRGTTTNDEGYFEFQMQKNEKFPIEIHVSYIGYKSKSIIFSNESIQKIELKSIANVLPDIVVIPNYEKSILEKFWDARKNNYPQFNTRYKGFLRQTVLKKDTIKYLGETVIDYFKSSYNSAAEDNQIQLLKIRKFVDGDNYTDSLRLFGAPFLVYSVDYVKTQVDFINPKHSKKYIYEYVGTSSFQGNENYKITFKSKTSSIFGFLLLNEDNFAINYISFNNTSKPISENNYLKDDYHMTVSYKHENGLYTMQNFQSSIRFTNKKTKEILVAKGNYATTESTLKNAQSIPFKNTMGYKDVLMTLNQDTSALFWKQYNIIAPSKKVQEFIKNNHKQSEEKPQHWATRLANFHFDFGIGNHPKYANQFPTTINYTITNPTPVVINYEGKPNVNNYFSVGFHINRYHSIKYKHSRNLFFGSYFKSNSWMYQYKWRINNQGKPSYLDLGLGYSVLTFNPIAETQNTLSNIELKMKSVVALAQFSYPLSSNIYLTLSAQCEYIFKTKGDYKYTNGLNSSNYLINIPDQNFKSSLYPSINLGIRYYLKPLN